MIKNQKPKLVDSFFSSDERGCFSKPFSVQNLNQNGTFEIAELYWSKSHKGTIRGMHFQVEPFEGWKAVWVSNGAICDVVVDVSVCNNTPTIFEYHLNEKSSEYVLIPPGFAHGFQALEENTIVNYAVSSIYSPEHDRGIHWDSFGYSWPLTPTNISVRDNQFQPFSDIKLITNG